MNQLLVYQTSDFFYFEDDIDLEDTEEKPVAHNMTVAVTKQNLTSKFQAFKGD